MLASYIQIMCQGNWRTLHEPTYTIRPGRHFWSSEYIPPSTNHVSAASELRKGWKVRASIRSPSALLLYLHVPLSSITIQPSHKSSLSYLPTCFFTVLFYINDLPETLPSDADNNSLDYRQHHQPMARTYKANKKRFHPSRSGTVGNSDQAACNTFYNPCRVFGGGPCSFLASLACFSVMAMHPQLSRGCLLESYPGEATVLNVPSK